MDAASHPVLALRGYGAAFGQRRLLDGLELTLPATGIDVLMGPVKTGKSTLLRSLAGLNAGNALFRQWGQAELAGRPIDTHWRAALVQQHAAILNATVRDAVIHHARQGQERSALAWTAFAHEALTGHGLESLHERLDDDVLSLPLEWQRALGILSLALTAPPLLMIDEPTFGLDEAAASRLVAWLTRLGGSQRLLVALHHQGQARALADRIVLLGGGRLIAHEPCEHFFSHPSNEWVAHFTRTGSLPLPGLDARPDELEPAAPQTPPAALPPAPPVAPPAPEPPVIAPATPGAARLPPLSRHGVEQASMVGRAIMSNHRGPSGFHWIVPGRLGGCAEPGLVNDIGYDLGLLADIGVTHLITLTEKDLDTVALKAHGLSNLHLPVFDREAPTLGQAYMLVRRMQALIDAGNVLAVHCKAGLGRTGTLLAAWLIREGGLTATDALHRLRNIAPAYVQTQTQEEFLQAFEQDMLRRL